MAWWFAKPRRSRLPALAGFFPVSWLPRLASAGAWLACAALPSSKAWGASAKPLEATPMCERLIGSGFVRLIWAWLPSEAARIEGGGAFDAYPPGLPSRPFFQRRARSLRSPRRNRAEPPRTHRREG